MCHVICRMPPSSWQSPLGRSRLSALLSSLLWIKWMRLTLKRMMSKQHSFHVTFVALTFWWVWDPFVEILTRPSGCWVCLPFYSFILTLSMLTKGEVKGYSCDEFFTTAAGSEASGHQPHDKSCCEWNLRASQSDTTIMSREVTWFFLVLEQFWPFICSIDFTVGLWFQQLVNPSNYQRIEKQVQMVKWHLISFWKFNKMVRVRTKYNSVELQDTACFTSCKLQINDYFSPKKAWLLTEQQNTTTYLTYVLIETV